MNDSTPKILIDGLAKNYGAFTALNATNLEVRRGEFLTLLGPSGSGKTTLLQMVSGLVPASSGRLLIDGEDWTNRSVDARDMGLVFQHYALFPHMTVEENVAFPLKMRKIDKAEITRRVSETLEKVQLSSFAHRYPKELSGGQQQRVALARCFVFRPEIILMDEPLGALDKALRESMQLEIRHLHKEFGTTLIYVTHDQEEALVMSDRICVMNHAQVEQVGAPNDIYSNPETLFSATFIGHSNVLHGQLESDDGNGYGVISTKNGRFRGRLGKVKVGSDAALINRPELVHLGEAPGDAFNELRGTVRDVVYVGSDNRLIVELPDGEQVTLRRNVGQEALPAVGDNVAVHWAVETGRILS